MRAIGTVYAVNRNNEADARTRSQTLSKLKFQIGDFLDVSIQPGRAHGGR